MKLNVAIIEDEPATARSLKYIIENAGVDISVLATLGSIADSSSWLKEHGHNCHVLFMDISLTDGLSFEIFNQVKLDTPVIFVTAYNDYALKAFKANGIDYILKPFDESEIIQALEKFNRLKQAGNISTVNDDLLTAIANIKQQMSYKKSFLVHYRDKLIPLASTDIHFFYSINEIAHAITHTGQRYIIDTTLEKLQLQLDPVQFYRANRQFIINRRAIIEVNFYFNGRFILKVQPELKETILISKAKTPEFKDWMNV